MIRPKPILALATILTLAAPWPGSPSAHELAGGQDTIAAGDPAPTSAQIQSLIARAAENQHRDDRASEEFERIERVISHKSSQDAETISDRTDRVLPTGNGTMKLQLKENGVPVSQDLYRRELQYAVSALSLAIHPNDRYKQDLVKFEKRRRDQAELVDTGLKAFRITWEGRETRGSRTLDKFLLEPDPNYRPTNRLAVTFAHVRATLWLDESEAQFARLEGDITSDVTFGGGIVGKLYHGGHFVMEQSEVAPGIWLPTLYTYDLDGRKFFFSFGIHERTEVSRYQHVGPPAMAIELVRNDLNNLSAATPTN